MTSRPLPFPSDCGRAWSSLPIERSQGRTWAMLIKDFSRALIYSDKIHTESDQHPIYTPTLFRLGDRVGLEDSGG